MNNLIYTLPILLFTTICWAQSHFIGTPSLRISVSGIEHTIDKLDKLNAEKYLCVIEEIDGKLYWKSRDNKHLIKTESGAFSTYTALDGSGYVRIIRSKHKTAASLISETEKNFDYVESLHLGLGNVSYYGKSN